MYHANINTLTLLKGKKISKCTEFAKTRVQVVARFGL